MTTTTVHTYRGFEITKHDTGARRMGREITFIVRHDGQTVAAFSTLRHAKAHIDTRLDATADQKAHADMIANLLASKEA